MPANIKALMNLVIAYLLKILNLGGLWGYVGGIALKYGGQGLYTYLMDYLHNLSRSKDQKAAKEAADKVLADPASTPEQRGQAYEKYFNSGR